jgi:NAD(P)-dependent dehydrogenase (short-subunit alcohol dehydrogenase family)
LSTENRVAAITGGTSGIGLAAASALAKDGVVVVLAARSAERGRAALDVLRRGGAEAMFVQTDVSREDDVVALFDEVHGLYGRLDIAVNAASSAGDGVVAEVGQYPTEAFDRTVSVSLRGLWLCLREEVRRMSEGSGGVVINVSSVSGLAGGPGIGPYAAAKAGVESLTRTAALEYAARDVRVNSVCPGAVRTPMLEELFARLSPAEPQRAEAAYLAAIPQGRLGTPTDLGEAIRWLSSPAASYITGATLIVDGGMSAGRPRR